jgi:hypothetical protein
LPRWIWTSAALLAWLAQPARADVVADGGVPGDAAPAAVEADAAAGGVDAAPDPSPASRELATPPELSSAQMSASTPLVGDPTPAEAEPPRPITRRLWFWMAITGVIVVGVLGAMALSSPNTTRPECPSGYVCPP